MSLSYFPGRPGVQVQYPDTIDHLRQIAQALNRINGGHGNWTASVTLTANAATTQLVDSRISASTFLGFMPQTADAAAELGNGTLYANCTNGSATLHHANNAQADRTFTLLLIG
ncbi:MAG: hypothetical protein KGL35_21590 [Bradyrhizobium sp.]|nr:hypothetical protein [Bradyrhizobium sp.]